ncbi:hypothetical protein GCM10027449_18290 [Sinomonas notoginsengisoli]
MTSTPPKSVRSRTVNGPSTDALWCPADGLLLESDMSHSFGLEIQPSHIGSGLPSAVGCMKAVEDGRGWPPLAVGPLPSAAANRPPSAIM